MPTLTDAGPQALREAAEALVAEHWKPTATVREWWAAMATAGLSQPTWPLGLGGRGALGRDARAVTEVFSRVGVVAPPTGGVAVSLCAPTILDHGSDAQKEKYVTAIAAGEESWCQLFSEPGFGSDLAGVTSSAVRRNGGWVVTGQKVWNSAADVARRGLLLARTDPAAPKHLGLTMFAFDMDQPGVEVRPLVQMNGDASFCEVFLTDCLIRDDDVIGEVNDGWSVARTTLRHERAAAGDHTPAGLVAVPSGAIAGQLDRPVGEVVAEGGVKTSARVEYAVGSKVLVSLAQERRRIDDPVLRDRLAHYYIRTRINRMLGQKLREVGASYPGAEGNLAKLALVAACLESRDLVFDVLGADGMLAGDDAPLGGKPVRSALGAAGSRIGGGTDEIQRNVIGERALGLPREPAAG
ncbi:acyl-CoA dehydrogenase family protein [Acidiferrimicrobium sp. IK]|uniref:acyl-CoA dehydrogenase family protein n=1 Tax=Acidiferrimicrobium sp. IK TaxID=2871700 RepID=UPI0021CB44AA|nr:acyl-CoA dehydrogenase family protein [Acidiferrimicrobium sp. IK]MCU4186857.1 acyl-CoA dehydrogenase family protein [Acidiferrimicrobium sp. IK]